jgi:hypothetical protein
VSIVSEELKKVNSEWAQCRGKLLVRAAFLRKKFVKRWNMNFGRAYERTMHRRRGG